MPDDIAAADPTGTQPHRQDLANRHIQLIAIGARSAPTLFMGSGRTISLAVRRSWWSYGIIGFLCFCVARDGRAAAVEPELQVVR